MGVSGIGHAPAAVTGGTAIVGGPAALTEGTAIDGPAARHRRGGDDSLFVAAVWQLKSGCPAL